MGEWMGGMVEERGVRAGIEEGAQDTWLVQLPVEF